MVKRPSGGGRSRGGVRAVYEDFRPVSEWKQDDESHILNVYLPGFTKEQVRVSTERQNTIRVHGERLVAGNKWSRFLEDFQVPENGEMNSILPKFQGGTLNITVPINQVNKPREKVISKVSTSQPPQETTLTPKPKGNDVQNQTTDYINDQENFFQEVSTARPADERTTQEHALHDDDNKRAHDKNGDQRVEKERSESKEKNIASDRLDDLASKMVDKERKMNQVGMKELAEGETPFRREDIPEKKAYRKLSNGNIKYKKAVEGLAVLNEERQLLVNMGAGMLVIVSLTAYVAYKFASPNDKN